MATFSSSASQLDESQYATRLQAALRHERLIVGAGLSLVTLVSWGWILAMSADMYGSMRGASAWAMTTEWDVPHLVLLFAMWAVMMVAMMLPSVVPMVMLYMGVVRRSEPAALATRAYSMLGGYVLIWAAFSVVAAVAQRVLTAQALVSPMMVLANERLGGALLVLVAAYQFTALKRDCLDACRSPLALFTTYWRPGLRGAFQMGLRHAVYCLGCCWALMLLLFVGGVMNAFVIAALTLFVLIEKVTPLGRIASWVGGLVLAAIGVGLLLG